MADLERLDIAQRIRALVGAQDTSLAELAARLRVDELSLRLSVDEQSPYPTLDVIAAVVREYGVDPTWLLTGDYDVATHREAMSTRTSELPAAINTVIGRTTPHRSLAPIPRSSPPTSSS